MCGSQGFQKTIVDVERTVFGLPTVSHCPAQPIKAVLVVGNGVSNVKEVSSCCLLSARSVVDPSEWCGVNP